MKNKKNEILIRRRNKVIVDTQPVTDMAKDIIDNESLSASPLARYVATIMKNIENLGYTFSKELYECLLTFKTPKKLYNFYFELIEILEELVGADKKYNPMYPNFPSSVMDRSEIELYINALVHYWSDGTLYPNEKEDERLPLFDTTTVKVLDVGTEYDLREIFNNLCKSVTSLSETDKEDISWMFSNISVELPDEIPFKENAAVIGRLYIESAKKPTALWLEKYFKTATDVLRLITALSDGDISLASNTKFRSLRRPERRIIMNLLNSFNSKSLEEDMVRYKNRWIRIGEVLHPREYNSAVYSKVITAFQKLRNNEKISTYSAKLEETLDNKKYDDAIALLLRRPGEFARRLDQLLRGSQDRNAVVNAFQKVADSVSTPILLQVREHFLNRTNQYPARVFFPKGNLATSYCISNTLSPIPEKYCKAIALICENALITNYKQRGFMGNVYLSDSFKNYKVPSSQRSASKALKTITRGSRIPLEENIDVIRGFIWWTNDNNNNRVDLDLTATFFNDEWGYKGHISYTTLKMDEFKAYHSGDIVYGGPVDGDGAAEFIDIDINTAVDNGIRYMVFQVYSYTEHKFSELPNVMFGWMGREDTNSGEIFEPKTVKQKLDLNAPGTVSIPVIFDCLEREFIWCDMSIKDHIETCEYSRRNNNIENNLRGVTAACYSIVNMEKPSLYDLINLHIKARGLLVESIDEADIIFDIEKPIPKSGEITADAETETEVEANSQVVITPYDLDIFMGEYL